MKEEDRRIYGFSGGPLSPEKQAVLDRRMENLKAEQRRRYRHLAALKFPRKEREE
jgi:hypothetical protein